MNKEQMVEQVAKGANISKAAAAAAIDTLTDLIVDRAANGLETRLHKFGVFQPHERKARTGRNPQSGEPIQIAAKRLITFKASQAANEKL